MCAWHNAYFLLKEEEKTQKSILHKRLIWLDYYSAFPGVLKNEKKAWLIHFDSKKSREKNEEYVCAPNKGT